MSSNKVGTAGTTEETGGTAGARDSQRGGNQDGKQGRLGLAMG